MYQFLFFFLFVEVFVIKNHKQRRLIYLLWEGAKVGEKQERGREAVWSAPGILFHRIV